MFRQPRAMLRLRLDVACNEGALRSNIPIIVKQPGGQQAIVMDKIADRVLRACYLKLMDNQMCLRVSRCSICWLNARTQAWSFVGNA